MRALMLSTALFMAAALPAAPAQAGDDGSGFGFVSGGSAFGGGSGRGDRRRVRGTDTVLVYDRGYQGDTAWRAESFNDWWHERPNRSYPAWVMRNRDCQRRYWQGDTLTC